MLEIVPFVLGPVATNVYLIADAELKEAAVIDPGWDGRIILAEAQRRGWRIGQFWYTHAHFDHLGGAAELAAALEQPPAVALHPADRDLWESGGGGVLFGFPIDPGPQPSLDLAVVRSLRLGVWSFEVRPAPGHTPGSVIYSCAEAGLLFSGDLIFRGSVGRTDLLGGDPAALLASIRDQVLSLPDATRILPGHGPETTVGEEKRSNPFLAEF
ncbi:MAG: MBL fold metallo-hydrolase [Anaerolineales bacterium]|jgi:glyoxylase-like metal-dependent hydrolase (beta-lactamase superfamily II)